MKETTPQVLVYPGEDETAYLLQSEANKRRLLRAIDNVAHQQNLVEVEITSTASCSSQSRKTVDCNPPQALIQEPAEAQQEVCNAQSIP